MKPWIHFDTFIISFYICDVSSLCILHPWRWPHGWLKHVRVQCVYKLVLMHLCASVVTTHVYTPRCFSHMPHNAFSVSLWLVLKVQGQAPLPASGMSPSELGTLSFLVVSSATWPFKCIQYIVHTMSSTKGSLFTPPPNQKNRNFLWFLIWKMRGQLTIMHKFQHILCISLTNENDIEYGCTNPTSWLLSHKAN